ncbi:TRAP transporter substrate-binding protein [Magnetospirillum molischianum]|uniref:TRAP-Type C4-dicarboxylate transport system, binding periplasmic protein (DctP subunit) n=1 Tax=Magnetospirillum molischianum DSM 120 TaxID=1150626 RepID=H8FRN1_MAGML|nr:TRAP transporter substrate-binding protein [Magnetospirillum molischianum]CCG41019.1 TRAP-Type C4-dicarboxylate transport system, binding periplasmic protein (DctP subunit) [Magnetospirillum molischianum DSM 120]
MCHSSLRYRLLSPLFAVVLAAFAIPSTTALAESKPIVIKFSHVVAPDAPKGKAAAYFKALAEERTKGRVLIEVYPNSQLYKDKEEMEALQLGAVQMLAPSLAKFGPLGVKEFEIFDLPYIFPSKDVLRAVTEGPVGRNLLNKLEPKGIIGLAYWDNGFKIMSANRPLRSPEDFRGLKMRIQSSKVIDAQFRALGAFPQVMAFSEVYQALLTGVVDGTENPPSNMLTQQMEDVQKYATVSNHGYLGYAVIVNRKFWKSLPDDIRDTLEGAMAEATRYANVIAQSENDAALEAIKLSGKVEVYTLTPNDLEVWRMALLPVHREMEGRVGKEMLDTFYKEAAKFGFRN